MDSGPEKADDDNPPKSWRSCLDDLGGRNGIAPSYWLTEETGAGTPAC